MKSDTLRPDTSTLNSNSFDEYSGTKWGFDGYITTDCGAADYVGGFLQVSLLNISVYVQSMFSLCSV